MKKDMKELSKNKRYVLFKLNYQCTDFEKETNKILSTEYKNPLKRAKEIKFDESNYETYFLYNWQNISDVSHIMVNDEMLKFRKCTAVCEFSTRKIKDDNGKLLPKAARLNTEETDVIFVQKDQCLYLIIYSFDGSIINRIMNLIKTSNFDKLPEQYTIETDMFTWLFYKYIKNDFCIGSNITIENITGFKGNVLTDDNLFKGDSESTADLLITKAFLALKNPITSIKIDVKANCSFTSFFISKNETPSDLRIIAGKGSETEFLLKAEDICDLMPIYIYFQLVPKIYKMYKQEKRDFIDHKKKKFLSDLSLQVIKELEYRNS